MMPIRAMIIASKRGEVTIQIIMMVLAEERIVS